jgi:hypothetical protein
MIKAIWNGKVIAESDHKPYCRRTRRTSTMYSRRSVLLAAGFVLGCRHETFQDVQAKSQVAHQPNMDRAPSSTRSQPPFQNATRPAILRAAGFGSGWYGRIGVLLAVNLHRVAARDALPGTYGVCLAGTLAHAEAIGRRAPRSGYAAGRTLWARRVGWKVVWSSTNSPITRLRGKRASSGKGWSTCHLHDTERAARAALGDST